MTELIERYLDHLYLEYLHEQSVPTKWRKRVEIYIMKGDKFIVGHRRDYVDKFLPPGGGVEKGQTLETASVIECLEELGVRIKNPTLITKKTFKVDWYKLKPAYLSDKIKKRMEEFRGSEIYFMKAEFDKIDKRYYGRDDDAMQPVVISKKKLIKELSKSQWDVSNHRVKIVRML